MFARRNHLQQIRRGRLGWDFIVEIPLRPPAGAPMDKWPGAMPVFVSGEVDGRRGAQDCDEGPQRAPPRTQSGAVFHGSLPLHGRKRARYARLFGEADTKRTLRRARELSIEGREEHKAEITFRFPDEEEHTADLLDWMAECVEGLGEGYGAEKIRLAETVGYGERNFRRRSHSRVRVDWTIWPVSYSESRTSWRCRTTPFRICVSGLGGTRAGRGRGGPRRVASARGTG